MPNSNDFQALEDKECLIGWECKPFEFLMTLKEYPIWLPYGRSLCQFNNCHTIHPLPREGSRYQTVLIGLRRTLSAMHMAISVTKFIS
jgi:hypothetical protein